jgi:hypothetical protein
LAFDLQQLIIEGTPLPPAPISARIILSFALLHEPDRSNDPPIVMAAVPASVLPRNSLLLITLYVLKLRRMMVYYSDAKLIQEKYFVMSIARKNFHLIDFISLRHKYKQIYLSEFNIPAPEDNK